MVGLDVTFGHIWIRKPWGEMLTPCQKGEKRGEREGAGREGQGERSGREDAGRSGDAPTVQRWAPHAALQARSLFVPLELPLCPLESDMCL